MKSAWSPSGTKAAPARQRRVASVSLIEMLVVVTIIAILCALLMPALKRAKEISNSAVCASNLRQIFIAFGAYAKDNNDYYPFTYGWYNYYLGRGGYLGGSDVPAAYTSVIGPGNGDPTSWSARRFPVLRCPGETCTYFTGGGLATPRYATAYQNDPMLCSYQWNYNINVDFTVDQPPIYRHSRRYSAAPTWSGGAVEVPFVMDAGLVYGGAQPDAGAGWPMTFSGNNDVTSGTEYTNSLFAYHHPGNRANVVYMDGHVSSVQHPKVTGVAVGGVYGWNPANDEPPQ